MLQRRNLQNSEKTTTCTFRANSLQCFGPSVKSQTSMAALHLKSSSSEMWRFKFRWQIWTEAMYSPTILWTNQVHLHMPGAICSTTGNFWRAYVKSNDIEGAEALQLLRNVIYGWQTAQTADPFWCAPVVSKISAVIRSIQYIQVWWHC